MKSLFPQEFNKYKNCNHFPFPIIMVKYLECIKLGFPYPCLLLGAMPKQPVGAGLQPCRLAAWLGRDGGSQMKDLGEMSVLVPSDVETKYIVGSLAPQPWLLLTPFPVCPALPVFPWQKVLETVCGAIWSVDDSCLL